MVGLVESMDENEGYLDMCPILIKSKEDILKTVNLITQKQAMLDCNLLPYDEVAEIKHELSGLIKSLGKQVKGIRW